MLDLVIRNGVVVDGTGAAARPADVGVAGGRIVELGRVDEPALRVLDVDGLVVAPGFIDIHTHYDAQVLWDPTLSPSPLHGVTTAVSGNCGFTLAPLPAGGDDYLLRMLSRVEGMPLDDLEAGVDVDWDSTAGYLERVDRGLVPNVGFLVGHSALRRTVMGEAAVGSVATDDQLLRMGRLLAEGLAAGALGFSSTWSRTHNDHRGDPVPSRHATREELLALCEVTGQHAGSTLEFIPGVPPFDEEQFDLMASMSRVADRPLNWNVLHVYARRRDLVTHQLTASDYAAEHGGRVIALTLPDSFRTWLNFRTGFILDLLPGWDRLMALPEAQKLAQLRDPAARAEMDRLAQSAGPEIRSVAHWADYIVVESPSAEYGRFVGQTVGDIAAELGQEPWDTLADIVVADRLRTVISRPDRGQDHADWQLRAEVCRDPRTLVGASDAGAHLDMIDSFSYATALLARAVREHEVMTLEQAVRLLTVEPARVYGLRGRGRIATGYQADLVVLDPTEVAPGEVATRYDLPAGGGRLYGDAEGIHHVIVSGTEVVAGQQFTGARPGSVLRSGRDTETVPVHRA